MRRRRKNIKEADLRELASRYPDTIGVYSPEKRELTTPAGDTLELELGIIGKSQPVFVKGSIREFLRGLDLPELLADDQAEAGDKSVSLSAVPSRQAVSCRSWGAWFKLNYRADPEVVCAAVRRGYDNAGEAIRKAKEAEETARLEAAEAETLKTLKELKKRLTREQITALFERA